MAFSMKKYGGSGLKWKVASRTLKLFVIGCLTQGADIWQGGSGIDLQHMRIPGILQRIAWAYCVVAMMKMWLPVYTSSGFLLRGSWQDTSKDTVRTFCFLLDLCRTFLQQENAEFTPDFFFG